MKFYKIKKVKLEFVYRNDKNYTNRWKKYKKLLAKIKKIVYTIKVSFEFDAIKILKLIDWRINLS